MFRGLVAIINNETGSRWLRIDCCHVNTGSKEKEFWEPGFVIRCGNTERKMSCWTIVKLCKSGKLSAEWRKDEKPTDEFVKATETPLPIEEIEIH